jgi:glycosyltransferase involved in cell wall biosynthesis
MRVFEAVACGSLPVTNDLAENGQGELFGDGVHLVTYRDGGEMLEKIGYYLAHEEEREAIAAAGRAEAVARHTYRHRMERLLAEAEERIGQAVVKGFGVAGDSPQPQAQSQSGKPAIDQPLTQPSATLSPLRAARENSGPSPVLRAPSPRFAGRGEDNGSLTRPAAIPSPLGGLAGPAPSAVPGLTSIIVPCFNQREFTGLCLQALFRHTRPAWELILINNGSADDTAAYIAGAQDAASVPVTIITNARNLGFPAAINQGLQVARGEYLVLLNNDAVVTDGWLDQLIALAAAPINLPASPEPPLASPSQGGERSGPDQGGERSGPARIGLVGPMSNYAAPPQWVENVPYRDLDEMQVFARKWRDEHRGQWFTAGKLSGFCTLMKRVVYDAIGGLDERFGLGLFDDDDLAERARRAGFELAVAMDLFIHHFGSRTFAGNGIDAAALLEENARRFAAKWGQGAPIGRRVELQPWSSDATPPPRAQAKPPRTTANGPRTATVSLTMIVRDSEADLPRCLESVRGIFDEIVVVDTGSTDRTREIAEEFGARVFDFPWIDDFAAARNAALSHATGDYAFWLDADDVVDPPEREKLRALLDGLVPGEPAAYVVRCACDPSTDGSGGRTVVDHIRLFPLREDVRWSYRVHEQILPALRRAGISERWTDLVVRHTGYTDPALRARKLDRDTRILLAELNDRPDEPFILFNLGSIAGERQDWPGALDYLRRSLARSAPSDSITRKLFALIARAQQMLGNTGEALRSCAEGLSLDPEDAELWFRKGMVHRHRGESAAADGCWRRILTLRRPEQFCSVDPGIYGHLTRRNLAVLAAERSDLAEAARLWREVLAECPGDLEAIAKLERFRSPQTGSEWLRSSGPSGSARP